MQSDTSSTSARDTDSAGFIELIAQAAQRISSYAGNATGRVIHPQHSGQEIRAHLEKYTFLNPTDPQETLADCMDMLERWNLDTTHPRHFGWFSPSPHPVGIIADLLIAGYNPQLATWQTSPVGTEIEMHVLRYLGDRMGYTREEASGAFTSGGAEANLTAMVLALSKAFPDYGNQGIAACAPTATCYASKEFHRTIEKAAAVTGIGRDAVRLIPVGGDGVMDAAALATAIETDRREGKSPFLAVANAGSTNMGALDPLRTIAAICGRAGIWFHVDAAWGGAAALSDRQRPLVDGIDLADSITVDPHKWLSIPMGIGAILTRHQSIMQSAFRVNAQYAKPGLERDFYTSSIQWSRRFSGLALFLTLAIDGQAGTGRRLDHQAAMADLLREGLAADGWSVDSSSPFPVVCFHDEASPMEASFIAELVNKGGRAWIASTTLPSGKPALRACVTSFRTRPEDIRELLTELDRARRSADITRREGGRGRKMTP